MHKTGQVRCSIKQGWYLKKKAGCLSTVALTAVVIACQCNCGKTSMRGPMRDIEQRSVLVPGDVFNADSFEQSPRRYLDRKVPGRIWQTARPGKGVSVLRVSGPSQLQFTRGEWIPLTVMAAPFAPVTFTSFDLGRFDNDATTITVRADSAGKAVARFSSTPVTAGGVNIVAGSPLSSGQARFYVEILEPERRETTSAAVSPH